MNKRIILAVALILAVAMVMAACSVDEADQQATELPTSPEATQVPTPAPTPIPPVTNPAISSYFMPGIAKVGVKPTGSYHIGIVLDKSYGEATRFFELKQICDAYEQLYDMTFSIEVKPDGMAQISAVDAMIEGGIDFLILSPAGDTDVSIIGARCAGDDVPYITINRGINRPIGDDGYVCTIEPDAYMAGVLTGLSVVDAMTERFGTPKGNIGEIPGVVFDEASMLWSMGVRRVLGVYEELNVVCSITGGNDDDTRYKAAVNMLKAFRKDELHGIITFDDAAAVMTLQAMADYDRSDMSGLIWTMGGTKDGLTGVWYGDFAQTIEQTTQTGMVALEYALQYLEGSGENIPYVVTAMTRVFSAKTQEKKDAIAALIADMNARTTDVCFESMGAYDLFLPDTDALKSVYKKPYYMQSEGYLDEFAPYTTEQAFYETDDEEEDED